MLTPGDTLALKECFLSLAEVEIFRSNKSQVMASAPLSHPASDLKVNKFNTNNANYLYLDLESSSPVIVQYLFWDNPRLKYYLNGKRATVVEQNGLRTIEVPAGRNIIEIRYRHWPLTIFWVLYALYASALLLVLIPTSFTNYVRRKFL